MTEQRSRSEAWPATAPLAEPDLDVLIVGAGISGIDAAYHIQRGLPDQRFAIFEARDRIGGTWDLFRYPGIRSDSDMHTLGFPFHPWRGDKAIADGAAIRTYIEETARTFGIGDKIRYRHQVLSASWHSADARWTIRYRMADRTAETTCRFLYLGAGYYDYAAGHAPTFPGQHGFAGRWIHPQHWPDDLDVDGKRIVVIGSGATAVTLVPALAALGAQVTMLQRSPTYIVSRPARDAVADALYRWLPERAASRLARWKSIAYGIVTYRLARRQPDRMRALIMKGTRHHLPDMPDVERHFTPRYAPWDQRLCLVPDADLFAALRQGRAAIVTDAIRAIDPEGIVLESGGRIEADIIVAATGLQMKLIGGIALSVDGVPVDPAGRFIYRGMMLEGVPNLVLAFGYTNASWTLKIDLVSRRFCRTLGYMRRKRMAVCIPGRPAPDVAPRPMLDFDSGYIRRVEHSLPRQGSQYPWRVRQNYFLDLLAFRFGRIADGVLTFRRAEGGEQR